MAQVNFEVSYESVDGDYGFTEGVILTCTRCGHSVEVRGTSDSSISRGAVMLREECPNDEANYYKEA